ncbi:MAG: hypothetical protein ABIG34_03270 [Candidatus Peregrinibacteria bacterium]
MSISKEECMALVSELKNSKPLQFETRKEAIENWLGRAWHVFTIVKEESSIPVEPGWGFYFLWRLWDIYSEPGEGEPSEEAHEHCFFVEDPMEDWSNLYLATMLSLHDLEFKVNNVFTLASVASKIGYEGSEPTDRKMERPLEGHGLKIWRSRQEVECAGLPVPLKGRSWDIVEKCITNEGWAYECNERGKIDIDTDLKTLNAPWKNTGWRIAKHLDKKIVLGRCKRNRQTRNPPENPPKVPITSPVATT